MKTMITTRVRALLLLVVLLTSAGCGYELVKESGIVSNQPGVMIVSVNVPVFKNKTFEPQVSQFFTQAFSRELASAGQIRVNDPGADATLQGTITSVSTVLSSLSGQGLALEKNVSAYITLVLSRNGAVVKTWDFADSEAYTASDINSEDSNKRAALGRIAARIARRFQAQMVGG